MPERNIATVRTNNQNLVYVPRRPQQNNNQRRPQQNNNQRKKY